MKIPCAKCPFALFSIPHVCRIHFSELILCMLRTEWVGLLYIRWKIRASFLSTFAQSTHSKCVKYMYTFLLFTGLFCMRCLTFPDGLYLSNVEKYFMLHFPWWKRAPGISAQVYIHTYTFNIHYFCLSKTTCLLSLAMLTDILNVALTLIYLYQNSLMLLPQLIFK